MKFVLALWEGDQQALLGNALRSALRESATTRLQLNLDDANIPETVLRLQHFDEPLTSIVSIWTEGSPHDVLSILRPCARRIGGWAVEERQPLVPPEVADGQRMDALSQVAFLRKPAEMPYDDWIAHWHGPHTRVAIETQATFGYVQNRVLEKLTEDTPDVDAIVEELFPSQAMRDIHAFYGSDGDQAELDRRLTTLMESVGKMGADRDLDVVPTSRYTWDLSS